jgi:hypothetical protein
MCFEVGGIDRDGLVIRSLLGQPHQDPGLVAADPTVKAANMGALIDILTGTLARFRTHQDY